MFFVQAVWAGINGMFWPDVSPYRKTFSEDIANLVNYGFLCEAYCIVGFLFLSQTNGVRTLLRRRGVPVPAADRRGIIMRGYFGALTVLVVSMAGMAGYAMELRSYASHYWFMEAGPPSPTLAAAGYYYLAVNLLLLILVVWVGFSHFGLFHVARDVSAYLHEVVLSGDQSRLLDWSDEEAVRQRLAPFARYVVTSKLFVFT